MVLSKVKVSTSEHKIISLETFLGACIYAQKLFCEQTTQAFGMTWNCSEITR